MDSTIHYTSVRNAHFVMESANNMRLNSEMCDVVVLVGNRRIEAHGVILAASVPFFYQKLKTRPSPLSACEYRLKDVDEAAALQVIEFCYTSAISVHEDNMAAILVAAAKLGCTEVVDLCCELLTSSLDIASCVQTHLMAASLGCRVLMTITGAFLMDNVDKLCASDTFLSLNSREICQFVASLLALDVAEMPLFKCTRAWFDSVIEDKDLLVLQFIEKFPALANNLKTYFHRVSPSDTLQKMLLYNHGDGDKDCQLATRATSSHDTTVSPAQDHPPESPVLQCQLHQVPSDYGTSPSQRCCSQCQPSVQECCQATNTGKTTRRKFSNQSDSSLCFSIPRLPGGTPASCDLLIKKCHVGNSLSQCYSRVNGSKELQLENRSRNSHSYVTRRASGLHYHNLRQKRPRINLSTEGHNLNQKKYVLPNNMKLSLGTEQSAPITVNKPQTISKNLPVRKRSLLRRSENTIQQQHPHDFAIIPPPESIKNQNFFQTDADLFSVSQKRSPHSSFITETSSIKEHSCNSSKDHYSLIVADLNSDRNNSNGSGRDFSIKAINSNSNGIDFSIKAINSTSNQTHPISSEIHTNCSLTELSHKCIDSHCGYLQHCPASLGAGEFTLEEHCLQRDRHSSGYVCVDKLGHVRTPVSEEHIRAPVSEEHMDSSTLKEATAGKSLVKDLSKAKPQTATKLQLLTCTICHWAFTERDALVKHTQTVHCLVAATLGDEVCSMTRNNAPTRDGQNRIINTNVTKNDNDNSNFGHYVAENIRGWTSKNTGSVCGSSQDVSDCKKPGSTCGSSQDVSNCKKPGSECGSSQDVSNCKKPGSTCGSSQDVSNCKKPGSECGSSQDISDCKKPGSECGSSQDVSDCKKPGSECGSSQDVNDCKKPCSVCKSSQDVTDNKSLSVSRHCCDGQVHGPAGSCLRSSVGSVSPPLHPRTHTIEMSWCSENRQLGFLAASTIREKTVSSCINNNNSPVDMSIVCLCGMSQIHQGPLDLSNYSVRNSHSPIGGCDMRFGNSNILASDSVAHLTSAPNNCGFVCGLSPEHGVPLTDNTDASLRLPSDFHMNDVHENDRETCMDTPASANGIPSGCWQGGHNSMSVKRKLTSHQSLLFHSRDRMVAYETARLTNTQTHHPTNASYKCHICRQNVAFPHDLKTHLCQEGINKPYTCPQCQHTFAKNIHLKRHLATHSGLKPYPCWICGKRFNRSDHLKRHTQSLHAGSKPHGCPACGKEFVRKYELSKHMTVHSVVRECLNTAS